VCVALAASLVFSPAAFGEGLSQSEHGALAGFSENGERLMPLADRGCWWSDCSADSVLRRLSGKSFSLVTAQGGTVSRLAQAETEAAEPAAPAEAPAQAAEPAAPAEAPVEAAQPEPAAPVQEAEVPASPPAEQPAPLVSEEQLSGGTQADDTSSRPSDQPEPASKPSFRMPWWVWVAAGAVALLLLAGGGGGGGGGKKSGGKKDGGSDTGTVGYSW
jgi:hypothetical protein